MVKEDTVLEFVPFGTMNGSDGKPFKTRDGGVMRLENLIKEIQTLVANRLDKNEFNAEEMAILR